MEVRTFVGGAHVPHFKSATETLTTKDCPAPELLQISLRQHIGAPAKAVVAPGDKVKKGQLIAEAGGFVSACIHSSVSGTVKRMVTKKVLGMDTPFIEIQNDFLEEWHEEVCPRSGLEELSGADIRALVAKSGLVGMGGAGFPFHVKISPPADKPIDTLILNGAECEPYLTSDHRLMLEDPDQIIQGVRFIMRALGVNKAYIAIETNKMDAIEAMSRASAPYREMEVVGLKPKYPQGSEKQLIYACTGREVPSGGLPMDASVVVCNVASAKALADYIVMGIPVIERICTVTGSGIKEPSNLLIKVGTSVQHIVEACGGLTEDCEKLILGGPMMGNASSVIDIPATKTTGGLLFLNRKDAFISETRPCIKCGKCVSVCPIFLQPLYISAYSLKGRMDRAEEYRALDCIECGSCSFICPSKRPLVHSIRVAKRQILENRRKQS